MIRRRSKTIRKSNLNPDEILLDLHNAPAFDRNSLEGRVERPISKRTLNGIFVFMILCVGLFGTRLFYLQLVKHGYYQVKSEQNGLQHIPIFADRGVVYDRGSTELAWNTLSADTTNEVRSYIQASGFGDLLGYVSYPTRDKSGNFWQVRTIGRDGVEKQFDTALAGTNGTQLIETNVSGAILSQSVIEQPTQGQNIHLSIDANVQEVMYKGITDLMAQSGYVGGAGAIMNVHTGELLAITSAPEYDPSVLSLGKDALLIKGYMQSKGRPFLNRMTEGLYTPGSIVKPFFALAALHEHIVTPSTIIVSTGQISVQDPYDKNHVTIFKDNAVHGPVNIEQALAVSSNIYFYEIAGGYGKQQGLGIDKLSSYAHLFGIGDKTAIDISGELAGNVPSIAWKKKAFPGDPWRIGDTYHTGIGQYGFQVTPIQMLRAVSAIANRGSLIKPSIVAVDTPTIQSTLPFTKDEYDIVQTGMRLGATDGTSAILNVPQIPIAGKTGTAQIKNNTRVNSWAVGFFPYNKPEYAYVVLMEDGPKVSTGATHAFRPVLDYFVAHPELLNQ